MPTSTGHLVLVRHGETEWSRTGQHTGSTDLPLLPDGEAAARALTTLLAEHHPVHVRCSPLRRARDTADLAGLAVDAVDDDLREWDYGGYEGLTTPQVRELVGHDWTVFADGVVPGDTPGETINQVAERSRRVLDRVRPHLAQGAVLLVGHGQSLRILTAVYLGQDPRFGAHLTFDPGAIGVLGTHHEDPVITRWNQVPPG